MDFSTSKHHAGFSLIELVLSMTMTLIILGVAVVSFSSALGSRERESSKTDAITSSQAALNIISREIGNSGFGIQTNGLGWIDSSGVFQTDCTNKRLHFRTNITNDDVETNDPDEDVTFYFDSATQSVVRYDANLGTTTTSGIINRISDVEFVYHNYTYNVSTGLVETVSASVPAENTARVTVVLTVVLSDVTGQPSNQKVIVKSDVTLRNSPFMLGQY